MRNGERKRSRILGHHANEGRGTAGKGTRRDDETAGGRQWPCPWEICRRASVPQDATEGCTAAESASNAEKQDRLMA